MVTEYEFDDEQSRLDHAFLRDSIAEYELQRGRLRIARVHQELACKSLAEILGESDISTLEARARLAEVMRVQGSPAAVMLYKELIGTIEEALGPFAENTLSSK